MVVLHHTNLRANREFLPSSFFSIFSVYTSTFHQKEHTKYGVHQVAATHLGGSKLRLSVPPQEAPEHFQTVIAPSTST